MLEPFDPEDFAAAFVVAYVCMRLASRLPRYCVGAMPVFPKPGVSRMMPVGYWGVGRYV